jgi:hypothetical protein
MDNVKKNKNPVDREIYEALNLSGLYQKPVRKVRGIF